jgi:O-antigen biosynthesis protein
VTASGRPRLSVVVPSYNGRHLLETCLASIARNRPSEGVEVIVADDASSDDTASWLATSYPDVRHVRLPRNGGFVAAANAGIAAAQGDFIQLLNNDAEVTAGWLETGLAPFDDPSVGSVAPLVLVRSDPSRVDSAGDQYSIVGWPSKRGHGEPAAQWRTHPADRVFGASGSSAIYRGNAIRAVGGFDPAFGSYYEDVDLAFRLRWSGYNCAFAPECVILHDVSATYDHARPELQRRMARNAEFLFWADLPLLHLLTALVPHVAFTMAQLGWRLMRRRATPFLLGKLDALRLMPTFRARRRDRVRLARSSIARPHFPMGLPTLGDVRNHLRRPREASSRSPSP